MPDASHVSRGPRIPLVVWFFGAGLVELAVALVAAYILHASGLVMLVLLPTLATMWGDNPATPHGFELVMEALYVFGGSFLLYGCVGLILGLIARALGSRHSKDA